jgi:hypothetical protein
MNVARSDVMPRFLLIILVGLFPVAGLEAADIRPTRSLSGAPLPGITIEGRIAPGDYQKLADVAAANHEAHTLWLASPGGNLREALRMGQLIRGLGFAVHVPFSKAEPLVALKDPANNTCSSSCFLLFAAGVIREGLVLGIHRPSLPADEYFSLGLDGAVAAQRVIAEAVTGYLAEMGVPAKYASLMLATNASEMVWLPAEDVRRDLDGVIAEFAEVFRGCPTRTPPGNDGQSKPAIGSGEQPTETADADCVSQRLKRAQEARRHSGIATLREK